jgi:cytochrome c biogenesis protein CcdA
VVVEYFYQYGCSQCAPASPIISDVIQRYDNITYNKYEVDTEYDGKKGIYRLFEYGGSGITPAVVINRQTIITYSDYKGDGKLLEDRLVQAIENAPPMIGNGSNLPDNIIEKQYLFSWEKVPGNDSKRLIKFLMQNFNIEWIKAAKINKSDDGKNIRITNDTNFLSLTLNIEKNNVNLEIDDGRTDKFIVKTENGELNIYEKQFELSFVGALVGGLVAGFNPCLLAVIAFMASIAISSKGGRRDLLIIIAGFCSGIFMVYMLFGLSLLDVVKEHPEIADNISLFLVVLIGLLGLWHFYDAYYLKKNDHSSFKTPESFIQFIKGMKGKNLLIISLIIGGIFSLIKLPCTIGFTFVMVDLLISSGKLAEGLIYLAIFNLGVILPVLILGVLMAFGLSPKKVDDFREKRRIESRLVTGAILLFMALLLYMDYTGILHNYIP